MIALKNAEAEGKIKILSAIATVSHDEVLDFFLRKIEIKKSSTFLLFFNL